MATYDFSYILNGILKLLINVHHRIHIIGNIMHYLDKHGNIYRIVILDNMYMY